MTSPAILAEAARRAANIDAGRPPLCAYPECCTPACRLEECGWPTEEQAREPIDIYQEPR